MISPTMQGIMRVAVLALLIPYGRDAAAQSRRFTLAELKSIVEQNHEQVRMNRVALEQAKRSTDIAAAAMLPKVDVGASYTRVSETGRIEFDVPGLFHRSLSFGDGNVYDAAVTVSYPVFTGFRLLLNREMQGAAERIAAQTLEGSILELRNMTAIHYRAAQLAAKGEAIVAAQERMIGETLDLRKRFLAEGQAIAFDTLQLSTRRSQLLVEREALASQHRKEILRLMQFTGIDAPFDVGDDVPGETDLETMTPEELTAMAFSGRYEFRNLETSAALIDLAVRSAKGAFLPSIQAQASYRYGRPGVDQLKNEWMGYYTASIRLEWNILSWGSDKWNVEKQELELLKTSLRENRMKKEVRSQIASMLEDLAVKRKTLSLIAEQIEMERLKLELAHARVSQGLGTVTELIDAETALTTALLRREQTGIERAMKLTELAAAVGREY